MLYAGATLEDVKVDSNVGVDLSDPLKDKSSTLPGVDPESVRTATFAGGGATFFVSVTPSVVDGLDRIQKRAGYTAAQPGLNDAVTQSVATLLAKSINKTLSNNNLPTDGSWSDSLLSRAQENAKFQAQPGFNKSGSREKISVLDVSYMIAKAQNGTGVSNVKYKSQPMDQLTKAKFYQAMGYQKQEAKKIDADLPDLIDHIKSEAMIIKNGKVEARPGVALNQDQKDFLADANKNKLADKLANLIEKQIGATETTATSKTFQKYMSNLAHTYNQMVKEMGRATTLNLNTEGIIDSRVLGAALYNGSLKIFAGRTWGEYIAMGTTP